MGLDKSHAKPVSKVNLVNAIHESTQIGLTDDRIREILLYMKQFEKPVRRFRAKKKVKK